MFFGQTMEVEMYRGHEVVHRAEGYQGVVLGYTQLKRLFENPRSSREVRVRVDGGDIRIAAPSSLIDQGPATGTQRIFGLVGLHPNELVAQIMEETVPDHWLTEKSLWAEVCRARGQHPKAVDPEVWVKLCTKRGYLLRRHNSRGF
jgi:hypothetical protein